MYYVYSEGGMASKEELCIGHDCISQVKSYVYRLWRSYYTTRYAILPVRNTTCDPQFVSGVLVTTLVLVVGRLVGYDKGM